MLQLLKYSHNHKKKQYVLITSSQAITIPKELRAPKNIGAL